jgi:hypothetical protein
MIPARASEDRMCMVAAMSSPSSTRSSVAASSCLPGQITTSFATRRSYPAPLRQLGSKGVRVNDLLLMRFSISTSASRVVATPSQTQHSAITVPNYLASRKSARKHPFEDRRRCRTGETIYNYAAYGCLRSWARSRARIKTQ